MPLLRLRRRVCLGQNAPACRNTSLQKIAARCAESVESQIQRQPTWTTAHFKSPLAETGASLCSAPGTQCSFSAIRGCEKQFLVAHFHDCSVAHFSTILHGVTEFGKASRLVPFALCFRHANVHPSYALAKPPPLNALFSHLRRNFAQIAYLRVRFWKIAILSTNAAKPPCGSSPRMAPYLLARDRWQRLGAAAPRTGPYYLLVVRDAQGRRLSVYLGVASPLVEEVRGHLSRLQAPLRESRIIRGAQRQLHCACAWGSMPQRAATHRCKRSQSVCRVRREPNSAPADVDHRAFQKPSRPKLGHRYALPQAPGDLPMACDRP